MAAVYAPLNATHNQKPRTFWTPSLPSRPPTYLRGTLNSHLGHLGPMWIYLSSIMASSQPMVKTMDATKQTCPLHNKQALLSYLLSLDRTLKSHTQPAPDTHGLPIAVGGSLASTSARSSRAFVRYPTWIASTASRPRRPRACFAQGSAACGVMRPFSAGATSSWAGTASSVACSHPPPAPRVRMATPIITFRTTTSSTPSPRTPDAVSTPVRGERTGCRRQALVSWVLFEGGAE